MLKLCVTSKPGLLAPSTQARREVVLHAKQHEVGKAASSASASSPCCRFYAEGTRCCSWARDTAGGAVNPPISA